MRATMYTPAVTMVAAWMSADTGVGPAIASGSQTKSGICALFPVAPMKSRSEMRLSAPKPVSTGISATFAKTAPKSKVPKWMKTRKMAMMNAISPMRLTMKALLPAVVA